MRAKDSCTGESIETSWSISRTRGWAADGGSEDRSWRSMESFVCQGGFREGAVPNQRVGMASTFMLQMIAPARGGQGGFGRPRDTVTALLCAPWAASTADASLGPESPFPSQTSTCHHLDAYYWPDIAFGFIRFMFPAAPGVGRARFFSKRHKIYVLARSSLGCYSDTHLVFLRGYIHISLVLVMFSALSFPPESPLPLGASSRTDHQAADVEVATRFLSSHSHIRCELSSFHLKASR
jgi:hypothetical protein